MFISNHINPYILHDIDVYICLTCMCEERALCYGWLSIILRTQLLPFWCMVVMPTAAMALWVSNV